MPDVTVTLTENGPYKVKGEIELLDYDGQPVDTGGRETLSLCRCGGSSTKPFCDGTHSKIGFQGARASVREA